MIIKDHGAGKMIGKALFAYLAAALIAGVLLLYGFQYLAKKDDPTVRPFPAVTCGAESIDTTRHGVLFVEGGQYFGSGNTRSSERARTGNFSCRLDKQNKFGFQYKWTEIIPGERFRVSVWRNGNRGDGGLLVIQGAGETPFYYSEKIPLKTDANGWDLLERVFVVPADFQAGSISAYIFGSGKNQVYFDDFRIEKIREIEDVSVSSDSNLTVLDLKIDPDSWAKIVAKRDQALKEGFLVTQQDDWVKGEILEDDQKIPVKLRLKGDLLDHLVRDKWSFRISVKAPYAWKRLVTFSVHTPPARSHLMEWVYHQLLEKEKVLTPRYDFIMLRLNGKNMGIYAYEEHFEKQLAEYQSRREGPIIRMEEEGVWRVRKHAANQALEWGWLEQSLHSYEASRIQPFGEKRTVNDTALLKQFRIAQNLLYQHKFGLRPASELFDLDLLAKYYALTDLARAYHGIVWHNERFYYNPVIARLEPIGFDGYTATGVFPLTKKPFIGSRVSRQHENFLNDRIQELFLDPVFAEKYYFYLNRFTEKEYVNEFLMDLDPEIRKREKIIRMEYDDYEYDRIFLPENARKIHNLLLPVTDASVAAYLEGREGGKSALRLCNFHIIPMEVVAWGISDQGPDQQLPEALFLPGYEERRVPVYSTLKVPLRAKFIYYHVPGLDSLFLSRILPWETPKTGGAVTGLFRELNLPQNSQLYRIAEEDILFFPGLHRIEKDIVIPEGYVVRMGPGTQINLVKGARFISRSPLRLIGEEGMPIQIYSEDRTGQGLTVLQAESRSELKHVVFEDLTTLDYDGWTLTGAVTFYESDVDISHCVFREIHCEDGLNLIRSKFSLLNSIISDTYSDGFDADFCEGSVRNCRFFRTGNDGMDLSGSVIKIIDCEVSGAGDKGISVGEQATVNADKIRIFQSVTGVASKDLSRLSIGSIVLKDCTTGFAAYQKKPEFGGSTITVEDYEAEDIRHLHLIEKGSTLLLGGTAVEGI